METQTSTLCLVSTLSFMTNLLETSRVSPPPHTVADQSLPLNFLDYIWLSFPPMHLVLFYDIPNCSKPHFLETIVPKLKQSLSITLKHYFPLAGYVFHPLNPEKRPEIRYRAGDSASFTLSESGDEFSDLVGSHARGADKFYDFVPQLEQRYDEESDENVLETLAVQVTLFPGSGVSIGVAHHHGVCDASSIGEFIKSWALINKHGNDDEFLHTPKLLPVFDRSLIKYPPELDSVFLNQIRKKPAATPPFPTPLNRVRATFVLTESDINRLKEKVQAGLPESRHVSSFVAITAYVWSSLAKSLGEGEDDDPEFFIFTVDARARISPPVPGNYFGNCGTHGLPMIRHGELVGEEGVFRAAEAISGEIQNRVIKNKNILDGAENWSSEVRSVIGKRLFSVSGSARWDLYGADFGWGRARKMEGMAIDGQKYTMFVCKSRDFEGGVEISFSLPKLLMDDFAPRFSHGLDA